MWLPQNRTQSLGHGCGPDKRKFLFFISWELSLLPQCLESHSWPRLDLQSQLQDKRHIVPLHQWRECIFWAKNKKKSKLEYFKQRTVVIFQYVTTHIQCIHIHTFLFSSKEVPWSIFWDEGGETPLESLGTGEQLKWTITLISRIKMTLKGSVNMVNKIVSKPSNIIFLALAFQR